MKLSSGVARIPEMLRKNVPVGLAVDGSASNDGSSLLEEIRMAYLLHRLTSAGSAPDGYQILKMATRGSARILGRDDLGQIAPQMAADAFLIDEGRLSLTGAMESPGSVFGTVGLRGNVDMTIVNGKVAVRDGHLVNMDEEEISARSQKVIEHYR